MKLITSSTHTATPWGRDQIVAQLSRWGMREPATVDQTAAAMLALGATWRVGDGTMLDGYAAHVIYRLAIGRATDEETAEDLQALGFGVTIPTAPAPAKVSARRTK